MTKVIGSYDDRDVSLLAVHQYFRWVRWSDELPREQEAALFAQIKQGSTQARDRVVEGFQSLVIRIAQRYRRMAHTMELLDLIQEGNIGLLKAIAVHEEGKGGFTGLASRCIASAICDALFHRDKGVHLSDDLHKDMRRVRRARELLRTRLDREPTIQELAVEMQMSAGAVRQLFVWWHRQEVLSLQAVFEAQEVEAEDQHFLVALYAWGIEGEAGDRRLLLVERESGSSVCLRVRVVFEALRQAFDSVLTQRQQLTLQMLYGLGVYDGGCVTRQEVAQHIGMTYSAICYYEREAYKRLQRALASVIESREVA